MTLEELRKLEKGTAPLAKTPADYPSLIDDKPSVAWMFAVLDHMSRKDRGLFMRFSSLCAIAQHGTADAWALLPHLYETVRKQLAAGTLYSYLNPKLLHADFKPKPARVNVRMSAVRRACAGLPDVLAATVRELALHDARKGVASVEEWAAAMRESMARIEGFGYRLAGGAK